MSQMILLMTPLTNFLDLCLSCSAGPASKKMPTFLLFSHNIGEDLVDQVFWKLRNMFLLCKIYTKYKNKVSTCRGSTAS